MTSAGVLSTSSSRDATADPARFADLHATVEQRALGANVAFGVAGIAAATAAGLWLLGGTDTAPPAANTAK